MPKPQVIDLDRPMTVEEFAGLLDVAPRTISDYVRNGTVPCHKIGPQIIRIWPREALEATRHPQRKVHVRKPAMKEQA